MYVWLDEPGQRARVVHVVDELDHYERSFLVRTGCNRRGYVRRLHCSRPGESFDLCEKCDPVVSTRKAYGEWVKATTPEPTA